MHIAKKNLKIGFKKHDHNPNYTYFEKQSGQNITLNGYISI